MFAAIEENEVFTRRRSPRIQELIEHNRVTEPPRRSPRIAEQAQIREKMDIRIERQRQRRNEMDPQQKEIQLQQRRVLEKDKQSSMTTLEKEVFLEKRRNQRRNRLSQQQGETKNGQEEGTSCGEIYNQINYVILLLLIKYQLYHVTLMFQHLIITVL
ncbi:hypothetical protein MKW94_025735 [Papaver nudicaule]|uniref:Uncharacterized protein n=1 Tax=Papaver nudicaule TaxID=74823 RepID=A0AA41VUG2_PAPNU|nr:hypothetical protein [Papaver nudicaule]